MAPMPKTFVRPRAIAGADVVEAGGEGAEVVALDEAEVHVAERGRDLHRAITTASLVLAIERLAEEGGAALAEELHRVVEILDPEAQAHDASRVAREVARCLGSSAEAGSRRTRARRPAPNTRDSCPLRFTSSGAGVRHLLEVEALGVKDARALEVLDDEVERVVPDDAQRSPIGHGPAIAPR